MQFRNTGQQFMVVGRSIRIFAQQCSDPEDQSDEHSKSNKQANPLHK